ncbi:GntR family transcriptional regulator [Anaerobiospirillum sp. NML120449]|uniref:GntR family transcriptional regulator n=1 Tax=Anaerobiospirillum sp. NML120449 TaxID=2932817 RepID=UPI001FF42670|nr:GntR family transcriptional regulator [Anaerobiospirillum sp. NML120449]MCK0525965.1 GntR family transcriptional regulator [Anaerobiospirillum sp. NML120449]
MSVACTVVLPKIRINPQKAISPQIYEFLRRHITDTTITPGTTLSENSLSEQFSVSRQPVREALMRLSYEGLLSILPQRGSIVERICVNELEHTAFLRAAIEKACVANIVNLDENTRKNRMAQLRRIVDQQRNVRRDDGMRSAYLTLDDRFHECLCSLSGSDMAWNTVQSIKGQMDRIRFLSLDTFVPVDVITDEHELIFNHLLNGEIEACQDCITDHLRDVIKLCHEIIERYSDWFTYGSLNTVKRRARTAHECTAASAQPAD